MAPMTRARAMRANDFTVILYNTKISVYQELPLNAVEIHRRSNSVRTESGQRLVSTLSSVAQQLCHAFTSRLTIWVREMSRAELPRAVWRDSNCGIPNILGRTQIKECRLDNSQERRTLAPRREPASCTSRRRMVAIGANRPHARILPPSTHATPWAFVHTM